MCEWMSGRLAYPVSCEESLVPLTKTAVEVIIEGLMHTKPER